MWFRFFIAELVVSAVIAMFRSEFFVTMIFRVVGVTVIVGMLATSYFAFVMVRDAAIRWEGSPEDRSVAKEIFSRFYWYRAAEAYFQAVSARESAHEK
jgi:hypothetical protein